MKRIIQLSLSILLLANSNLRSQPFECSSDLYQVVNGNELKVLIPSTGVYESVGTSSITYNGAGFNSEDNYIYGIGSGTILVRIDNSGEATNLGSIPGFTALSYSGDFDLEGNWYSFKKFGSSWIMNKIDVSESPITVQEFNVTELAGVGSAGSTADLSYNAVSNKFYGMASGKLIEFDPFNLTVKTLADYSSEADKGGYGAVWSDESGKTYFFNNASGNIYRAEFDSNGNILGFAFIATSAPNGNNDGMGCPMAQSPIFPEICNNGLDDDNDGLIDCLDPDCTATTDCGVSGLIYSSTFACNGSIATYHSFFTNNSALTNTLTITDILPQGFVFLQDSIAFDAGGYSNFTQQPIEGDQGTLTWDTFTLQGGETVKLSYDVVINQNAVNGTQSNQLTVVLGETGTVFEQETLSSPIEIGACPEPEVYNCEPAFYQVYKKKGKNQPNVFGVLNPDTGNYNEIAIASDYANALGFDINTGLVYGASGKHFIQLDEDGLVLDMGITFSKKVYRGDINTNSEWFGAVGNDIVKIDVSGTPQIVDTYIGEGLPGWDMAYNQDGHFYALHSETLYQFNTTTNQKVNMGTVSGNSLPSSGGYGAQWTGSDGLLYASHNSTGKIIRVNVVDLSSRVVSQSIDGLSKNDGFSCPSEIPAVYEYDYSDNSRIPQGRILAYRQNLTDDDVPSFEMFWLGNTVSCETENPANSEANGDLDDGFGITTSINDHTLTAIININTNRADVAHYLIAIDWDDDGQLDQTWIDSIYVDTEQTILKSLEVPEGFSPGFINTRVIISEETLTVSNQSGDILMLGEIEDNRYEISEQCTGDNCESSSGGNGGLESNGNLASSIAKRNFTRLKKDNKTYLKSFQAPLKSINAARRMEDGANTSYFPETGLYGNEMVTISSPTDLIDITNATEVLALDYYNNEERIAACMLLKTEEEVYNHSKNVCDRLSGNSIEDVSLIYVDGQRLILTQIANEVGGMEYTTWFSIKELDEKHEIYSLWNVDDYPSGQYNNFQFWSSSPSQLMHIVKFAMAKLTTEKNIQLGETITQIPSIIVKNGYYENGMLYLTILNKNQLETATLDANIRAAEYEAISNQTFAVTLTQSLVQTIEVDLGYFFDAGLSLYGSQTNDTFDSFYLADGVWGLDYNAENTEIGTFEIISESGNFNDDQFNVERDFYIEAESKDVINVFRNLNKASKALQLDDYSSMSFEIQNSHPIEIVLVQEGLLNWEDRLKIEIPAHSQYELITLDLSKVKARSSSISNIETIVFSYLNKSGSTEQVSFSVRDVAFGNESIVTSVNETSEFYAVTLYPNPTTDYVMLRTTHQGEFQVLDLGGRLLRKEYIDAPEQRISLALKSGIYVTTFSTETTTVTRLLQIE